MTDLHEAFLEAPDARPDLVAAVTARIRRNDRRRHIVILASTLAGVGIAVAAMGATGVLGPNTRAVLEALAFDPWTSAVVGIALTAIVACREGLADF